jgi:hypothetical protein
MEVKALRFLAQPGMGIDADDETFGMRERPWKGRGTS